MRLGGTVVCATSIFMCISSSVGAGVRGIGTVGAGSAYSHYQYQLRAALVSKQDLLAAFKCL